MSTDYELSRIYAEGWNAAGKMTAAQSALLESGGVAALNPYTHHDKRARERWAEGFGRALGKEGTMPFRGSNFAKGQ